MVSVTQFFPPEGRVLHTAENQLLCSSLEGLHRAKLQGTILEGMVLSCGPDHDLAVALGGGLVGRIPREEAALGVAEGTTRDVAILTRVGRPVSFLVDDIQIRNGVPEPLLSRRRAQRLALDRLLRSAHPGDILPAVISHLEPFGAFVDIGCGVTSLIGIEHISVSRIAHPKDRFSPGQSIYAAILSIDYEKERLSLTHRELLGTWEENAGQLQAGMTVPGIVRSVKDYGAFVELTPNLAGLAEPQEGLSAGQRVSVYIKSILPPRMKVKLLILDILPPVPLPPLVYTRTSGHLDHWRYAPADCPRLGTETFFSA